jgi:aspartyl-tRNA(Asn)/glutamyl-tRNA(Gln) amidotransferase subunit C
MAMQFSTEDIEKLARLARLKLEPAEVERLKHDLAGIVAYVEGLKAVNVDGIEPMTHAIPMELLQRADEVAPMVGRDGLRNSKGYEDGLIKVPKIIE